MVNFLVCVFLYGLFKTTESETVIHQWCLTLCNPIDVACQTSLSMDFSRQEYWSGLPFPSLAPEDLPNPEIEPGSPDLYQMLYRLSHEQILSLTNCNFKLYRKEFWEM